MARFTLIAIAILLAVAGGGDTRARSLYVWNVAVEMTDGRRGKQTDDRMQHRLLAFCRHPNVAVRRVYFLVDPERTDPGSLGRFLARAAEQRLEVYALHPGSLQHRWLERWRAAGGADHGAVVDWALGALAMGRGHGDGFAGVQLDIEPHLARTRRTIGPPRRAWRPGLGMSGRRNRRIAGEYLRLLERVRDAIAGTAPGVKLAATIPTWYDRRESPGEFVLTHGGERKPLAFHVMDRVDFVTLMNYLDGTGGSERRVLDEVRDEIGYGAAEVMFETARSGRGSRPGAATTLHEEGEAQLLHLAGLLQRAFGDSPNFLGTAVHHYLNSYGNGKRHWPAHGN